MLYTIGEFCCAIPDGVASIAKEAVIIEMAIAFWFNDDDWGSATKVWDYIDSKNKLPE